MADLLERLAVALGHRYEMASALRDLRPRTHTHEHPEDPR